jgi:hypothetical protein
MTTNDDAPLANQQPARGQLVYATRQLLSPDVIRGANLLAAAFGVAETKNGRIADRESG